MFSSFSSSLSRSEHGRSEPSVVVGLVMENLALRQQVTVLKKEWPRPVLDDADRAFWVALRPSRLVALVGKPIGDRQRRHCCPLASRSIPSTLGEDLEASLSRATLYRRRDSRAHPDHGPGRLGRASHPR